MAYANGAVFYRGPSQLDGKPIVGIVTGLNRPTKNPKTGPMLQTWILRSHVNPSRAVETGGDRSICGSCALRGGYYNGGYVKRSCYVQVGRAPLAIYRSFKRGNYPDLQLFMLGDKAIRLGAYGDPAAIPTYVWQMLLTNARTWTGYTHAWRTCDQSLSSIIMASVDSEDERVVADALGWRTFRVIPFASSAYDFTSEVVCPASAEAGHLTTCARCRLCKGKRNPAKSVVIAAHGSGASSFVALSSLRGMR